MNDARIPTSISLNITPNASPRKGPASPSNDASPCKSPSASSRRTQDVEHNASGSRAKRSLDAAFNEPIDEVKFPESKRPCLEKRQVVVVQEVQEIWLPAEIWFNICRRLDSPVTCLSLVLVSKQYFKFMTEQVLRNDYFIERFAEAYLRLTQAFNNNLRPKLMGLYKHAVDDRSNNDAYSFELSGKAEDILYQAAKLYDNGSFIFNIFSKKEVPKEKSSWKREDHLDKFQTMAIEQSGKSISQFHAREVISYFIYDEKTKSLRTRGFSALFNVFKTSFSTNDKYKFAIWFPVVSNLKQKTSAWFKHNASLLKENNPVMEACQMNILNLLKANLPKFLDEDNYNALGELILVLRSPNTSPTIKVRIQSVIEQLCILRGNDRWTAMLINAIISEHETVKPRDQSFLYELMKSCIDNKSLFAINYLIKSINHSLKDAQTKKEYGKQLIGVMRSIYDYCDDRHKSYIAIAVNLFIEDNPDMDKDFFEEIIKL